ncbi:hypothetical protein JCM19301_2526 [Jejuia pallidilutea]|uniref:Uncharacterized protein n=1 Tax=Jejuia pallidilutea TaxID=504487 RepID=A0A090VNZ4_9FLAO|nr:hypothetical protein JCM19301_2526 [Jejuia pallidilutea]GAL69687.1 hypothetical protein JCM19302_3876 [Jejuia pallidilutea]GAL87872.1 hypothetical protein JCM19538_2234 [Jejuia pallidilutea]
MLLLQTSKDTKGGIDFGRLVCVRDCSGILFKNLNVLI